MKYVGKDPQEYTADLSHVTGKGARARDRAIEAILKEDFADLKLTYKPNPDKPEKILQFLHISSTIKKNVGGCVHVTYR